MKIIQLKYLLILITISTAFMSCVKDDNFQVPNTSITKPIIKGNIISIDAVLGNYNQVGEIVTFQNTNTVMEGYVISSDEGGNFFKELILQDKPENPTAGIAIQLDMTPLFTKYEFGRKVYVKLDGLSVGLLNGVVQLGRLDGTTISRIPASNINNHLIKSVEVAKIVPKAIEICNLSNALENIFIRLNGVQFNRKEVLGNRPKTFAAEASDQFDGERRLENCDQGGSIILSTSTFSDFKSLRLPTKKGTLDGILTRDFFDMYYTISINSPENLNFTEAARCDPQELDCGVLNVAGNTNLFSDDFESQINNQLITGNGWTNYIESGTSGWKAYTSKGSNPSQGRSARITSKNSGDDCSIVWLITPAIDLATSNAISLSFETSNSFADGSDLEVLFSTNWDGIEGNITNANWGILPSAYIVQNTDVFSSWFSSGIVDLSCATSNTIHIAFKYRGNGQPDLDGTYELDTISIDSFL